MIIYELRNLIRYKMKHFIKYKIKNFIKYKVKNFIKYKIRNFIKYKIKNFINHETKKGLKTGDTMTKKENLIAMLRGKPYQEVPVEFNLCPELVET